MALNDVTFITLNGGLGRILAGDDATSGILIKTDQTAIATPTVVTSVQEALALGITKDDDPELFYHVTNFFDQVSANLWLMTQSGGSLAADLETLQSYADGQIRQVAVIDPIKFTPSNITALNTAAETQKSEHKGLSILYTGVIGVTSSVPDFTLSTLPTLTTYTCPNVSVVVGKDLASPYSCIGATLGTVAASKVSENIGYVAKFNVVKTGEFDTLGFITGESYRNVTQTSLSTLEGKGYIFLRKYTGFAGSFHNDSTTATASTSDFATIENVRTIEKAVRNIRTALVPQVNSPLKTEAGKLSLETTAKFDLIVRGILNQMVNAAELSGFSIFVDPNQNVLSTSKLKIQVGLTPYGVAREIEVTIGFTL